MLENIAFEHRFKESTSSKNRKKQEKGDRLYLLIDKV